jgi:calcineurin-like phosphoesterase family protein
MRLKIDVSDGKNIFFISDFHLFHKNVIGFDGRPFITDGEPDLDLMHETLVNNWNSVVRQQDIVFYLGDLCFRRVEDAKPIVDRLSGSIHFIMGNHDKMRDIQSYKRFISINDYVDLTIVSDVDATYHFTLMHYPIYSWNRQKHGSYHVHGHCHQNLHHGESEDYYVGRKVIDVGCNGIDYTPISYKEIVERLENKLFETK